MADLTALGIKSEGFKPYLDFAHWSAIRDGRFFYYYSAAVNVAPYMIDSPALRALCVGSIQFGALISIAVFLCFFVRGPTALLFLVLACALLPNWAMHYPITSLPMVFHVPLMFFFASVSLHRFALRLAPQSRRARILKGMSYLLFILSCLHSEGLTFLWLLILCLDSLHEQFQITRRVDWRTPLALLQRRKVFFSIVAAFVVTYAITATLYKPIYTGTKLSSNLRKAPAIAVRYAVRGLPAANFFFIDYFTVHWLHRSPADARVKNLVPLYLDAPLGLLLLLLIGTCALYRSSRQSAGFQMGERCRTLARGQPHGWRCGVGSVFISCLGLAFAVQIPLSMTVKYQDEVVLDVYYFSYFSFLCFVAAAAVIPTLLVQLLGGAHRRLTSVCVFLLICTTTYLCFLNQVANQVTFVGQAAVGRKWTLINAWLETDEFRKLPSGAVIVAPSLWEGIDETMVPDYWTNYIRLKAGRTVPVRKSLGRPGIGASIMYLHLDNRSAESGGALFVEEVNCTASRMDNSGFLLSDAITVLSDGEPRDVALSALARPGASVPSDAHALMRSEDGTRRIFYPIFFEREHGFYRTVVRAPRVVVGTAMLVAAANVTSGRGVPVDMGFKDGFGGLEGVEAAGADHWRWCVSPSGEGTVTITNYMPLPIGVHFRAHVATGFSDPTRLELRRPDGVEALYVNNRGAWLETFLLLAPGANDFVVKSWAPRVGGADSRHLTFRISNWDLRYKLSDTESDLQNASQEDPRLKLTFEQGFSVLEGRQAPGSEYWRWSDGPSGEASLTVHNRTKRPLQVTFTAFVNIGTDESRRFEIRCRGAVAAYQVNRVGRHVAQALELKPGPNLIELKAYAPRVNSPDPRHLVFRLVNWKVIVRPPGG